MSVQKQPYINIDECITSYIDEAELNNSKYFKLWQLAFRAMTELGLDFFYQIKTVKLPVNPNLTVNIPADFLQYTKIGVLNQQGEIIPLYQNNKLTNYADLLPTRLTQTQDNTLLTTLNAQPNVFNNYWADGTLGALYGLQSGAPFIGSFKMDLPNGIILLNEVFTAYPYLIIEYVASPNEGSELYVPIQFKEAIIAYLAWKDIRSLPNSRKGSLGDKRDRRHEYYNERRLAYARWTPFYPQEAQQLNMESTRLTVKI